MSTAILQKIADIVNKAEKPTQYAEDESPGEVHSGNYDDCYQAGWDNGYCTLAEDIRAILESEMPPRETV